MRALLWPAICFIISFIVPVGSYAQCSADAGNNVTICQGQSTQLGGSPSAVNAGGGVSYSWNNGAAAVANPTVSPNTTTTYTLILSNGGCNGQTDQVTVTVLPAPNAGFTFSPATPCAGVPVSFTNTTTACPGCQYAWSFDNPSSGADNTSSSQNPSHTFLSTGSSTETFTVTLTVTSSNGCTDVQSTDIVVKQSPDAVLTEDANFTQCLGVGSFYSYVTNASAPANNANYTIHWGDGSPDYNSSSPPSSLEHIYNGVNLWTLNYTVTGANGCSDAQSYEVTNISNPGIGAATQGNTLQCGPVEFCFPLSNYSNNHISTVYIVNFGDGSAAQTFNHPPPAAVCHTYNTSTCANTPQYYTFAITADNNCTPSNATISPLQIFMPPTAAFTAPPAACVNSSVPFTNTTTPGYNQGCSTNTSYSWNFGDPSSGANNISTAANPSHSYSSPGTYTVTMTATNGGNPLLACGTTTYTKQICIEQPPTPVFTVNTNLSCNPTNIVTDNTTSTAFASCSTSSTWVVDYSDLPCDPDNGTYTFTGGTDPSSFEPSFLLSSVGVYTLRLRMTNSCGVFEDNEVITVNTIPVVDINSIPTVCAGASISPSATVDGCNLPVTNYAWTFGNGTPASSSSLSPGSVSYPNSGNFPVSFTATNACGPSSTNTTVSVLPIPNVIVASSDPDLTICDNGSTTLTASGAGTYSWSPSTGLSSSGGAVVTASPHSTTTYTITGTSGNCTDQATVTVIVDPLPTLAASGNFSMCTGETEQLGVTPSGGEPPYSNFSWSNGSTLNNAAIQNPVSHATVTTNYTVSVTDNNGCVGSGTVPLTVNPLPVVNAGPDTQMCDQPVGVQLTGFSPTSGGTGVWSGPNVTAAGVFTPNGLGTFTLTYCFTTASTGCTACDNVVITVVNTSPANAGQDQSVCLNGNPLVLPSGGTWSGSSQVTSAGIFTPTGVGPVTLTFTVGSGSCVTTDQMVVTVLQLPTANAGTDQTICAGQTVQLSASGTSPNGPITLFSWSGGAFSNSLIANPTISPSSTAALNVTVIDAAGCSAPDQVTVIVNQLPAVNAGSDIQVCNQAIATQLVAITPANGGVWSGTGVNSGGSFTPTGAGSFVLTYTYTNPSTSCTNTDQITVTVVNPTAANAGPDIQLCQNEPAYQIVPPVPGGVWSPAPVTSAGQFTPSNTGVYNLTYTLGSGTCQTQDQLVLTVYGLPTADAGPNQVICAGETTSLHAVAGSGQTPYTYSWNFPGTLSDPISPDPVASPTVSTTYQLTVTDAHQCQAIDNILVTVNPLPIVEAGPNRTVCNQQIVEVLTGFSPTSGGSGSWSGQGITNSSGQFTSPGVGTYWIYYEFTSSSTNCSNTDSLLVTVIPPVLANAGPDVNICPNEGVYQLNGFSPSSGATWSGPGITNATTGIFNPANTGSGTFTLTLSNGTGTCLSSDQMQIVVGQLPQVTVGPNQTVCGNISPFNMTGFSPGTGGTWVGPGITNSAVGTFDPGSAGPGTHNLYYYYENAQNGCSDTAYTTVVVSPVPIANFSVAPLGCTNTSLNLTNSSSGATQYNWNFGNGYTTSGASPAYTYPVEGIFDITLIVSNSAGCQDTAINANEILDPPYTAFELLPAEGCAPLQVSFQNNSVGQYLTYAWDLAIANSTDQEPASLTYQQGPDIVEYPVSLTATNFCGVQTSDDIITVYPQPIAGFGTDLDVFCSPFTVHINNISVGNPDTYTWDFGDNGPVSHQEEPGSHVFFADTIAVDYTISLYLSSECGADTATYTITVLPNTVTAFFNTDIIEGCSPLQVEFTNYSDGGTQISYDFDDGTFTGDPNPIHIFTDPGIYHVEQYVDNGCSYDTTGITITVNPSPLIDFSTDVPDLCANDDVQFVADPGTAVSISWDFGDGDSSALSSPSHFYSNPGTYTVIMTGTNDNECVTTVSHPFTVHAPPAASFSVPDQVGCSPFDVCFSNASTGGLFYSWDFGDGNTDNDQEGCNTYTNFGSTPELYTVSLIVQNMNLCSDTFELDVIVSPQPTSAFLLSGSEGCDYPVTVSTTNLSLDANAYDWFIDGISQSDLTNDVFTLDTLGEFEIMLTASNQFGCEHSSMAVYTVYPMPEVMFESDLDNGCVDLLVSFENNSSGAISYAWNFGDGATSNASNPVHNYTSPGVYDVSLIATTVDGCKDTLEVNGMIEAYNLPVADFVYNPEAASIYNPTFTFYDSSFDAHFWKWDFGDGEMSEQAYVQHTYAEAGSYPVTLTVWNEHGCRSEKDAVMVIQDIFNLFVPNAFTPDDDGINEVFLPQISGEAFIERYQFQVVDRWGTIIFETANPKMAWTGNVRDGGYFAKDDAYNWQVKVQLKGYDDERIYSGHVILIR